MGSQGWIARGAAMRRAQRARKERRTERVPTQLLWRVAEDLKKSTDQPPDASPAKSK